MSEITSIQKATVYTVPVAPGVVWSADERTVMETALPYFQATMKLGESLANKREQIERETAELIKEQKAQRQNRLCVITTLAVSTLGLLSTACAFAAKQWL